MDRRHIFSYIYFSMLTGNMNIQHQSNYINIKKKVGLRVFKAKKKPIDIKKLLQHKYIFVWFSFLNTLYKTCFLSTVFIKKKQIPPPHSYYHHTERKKKNSLNILPLFTFSAYSFQKNSTRRLTRVALFLCGKCLYTFLGVDVIFDDE